MYIIYAYLKLVCLSHCSLIRNVHACSLSLILYIGVTVSTVTTLQISDFMLNMNLSTLYMMKPLQHKFKDDIEMRLI